MKRRQWTAQQKLKVVLEGLKSQRGLSEVCQNYEISQAQFYKWRDQLLANGTKAFESDPEKTTLRLEQENRRLKTLVGHLTMELKKTEFELL